MMIFSSRLGIMSLPSNLIQRGELKLNVEFLVARTAPDGKLAKPHQGCQKLLTHHFIAWAFN